MNHCTPPPTIEYPATDPETQHTILHEMFQWSADGAAFLVQKVQDEPEHKASRHLRRRFFQQQIKRTPGSTIALKAYIPLSIRWEVWERDNFTCQHCGSRRRLAVDHVIPESKGGAMEINNLQTLCKSCNSRKGSRS